MHPKEYLRQKLRACDTCYARYVAIKYRILSLLSLRYFFYDLWIVHQSMFWGANSHLSLSQLRAKLLFYYHKIEKGLCMPGRQRLFGIEVIPQILQILESWKQSGFSTNDPVYLGAINSLQAYVTHLQAENLDPENKILSKVSIYLRAETPVEANADTPIIVQRDQLTEAVSFSNLRHLYLARRSARNFDNRPVANEVVARAVEAAQLSPSACNRQPCKVFAISDEKLRVSLLSHQNGNAGFGHLAPLLLVVTANADHFFGAIERNQPYIDGGLFTMSLLYALQVQGLATCCLNWCVTPKTDIAAHKLLDIPKSQKIIMYIAVGYAQKQTKVPRSHRKALNDVLEFK
ncbi:Nitro_FMN_reductase domain containing protein [Comamonadaceae bacterium]